MMVQHANITAMGVINRMTAPQPRLSKGLVRMDSATSVRRLGTRRMITKPVMKAIRKPVTQPNAPEKRAKGKALAGSVFAGGSLSVVTLTSWNPDSVSAPCPVV